MSKSEKLKFDDLILSKTRLGIMAALMSGGKYPYVGSPGPSAIQPAYAVNFG